jgi:hypothetical protein
MTYSSVYYISTKYLTCAGYSYFSQLLILFTIIISIIFLSSSVQCDEVMMNNGLQQGRHTSSLKKYGISLKTLNNRKKHFIGKSDPIPVNPIPEEEKRLGIQYQVVYILNPTV